MGRNRPEKQGCRETVVAATMEPNSNARRRRTDQRRDLRFAAYPRDTVHSNRAKFGKHVLDGFEVMIYDEVTHFDRILYNYFKISSGIHSTK